MSRTKCPENKPESNWPEILLLTSILSCLGSNQTEANQFLSGSYKPIFG